jgi:hypothetical protein
MRRSSRKNTKDTNKRLDPAIVVALIGLVGTIIAALLASPLLERWFSAEPSVTGSTQASFDNVPDSTQTLGDHIGLGETVSGTLYYNEAGVWIFNDGPAMVTIVLDMSPYGDALIILRDPSDVERAYVEQQDPGIARLVRFNIPDDGDYTILVRNTKNEQVNYTLTVQDALTPPPP